MKDQLILHHYDLSPFSEKVRLMLGHCGLSWQSLISPAMPPRPNVDPLAGGYRRIPVAQIGADIFCDTRVITTEIARLSSKPDMAMENCSQEIFDFVEYTDGTIFMAAVRSGSPLRSIGLLLRHFSPWQAYRFIKDRAGISQTSSLPGMSQGRAIKTMEAHKEDMNQRLQDSEFLFGDSPTIADFSAYHLLWFSHNIRGGNLLGAYPKLQTWFDNMTAFGEGDRTEITQADAFAIAMDAKPRPIASADQDHELVGQRVEIKPTDYAKDAVTGELVGSCEDRWILARGTADFGTVHVHFPKTGFKVTGES
ncbi:MAG: glutathione S-transferase family protein [Pseudomonadota bacterium]